MTYTLVWVTLTIAVLDWVAVAIKWKSVEYITKPTVIIILLVWLWMRGGNNSPLVWFSLGLAFSLAGDVFLMLPREKFLFGCISFTLTCVFYSIGFNTSLPQLSIPSVFLALLIGLTASQIYRRVVVGLKTSPLFKLRIPILIYTIVISLMLFSALLTLVRPSSEWLVLPALLVSAGALLFFLSDTLLAWNRFVTPLSNSSLKVVVTYHLAQIAITLGVALNFPHS